MNIFIFQEEDDHQKYSTLPSIGSTKMDYSKHPQNNTISKFTTLPSNRGKRKRPASSLLFLQGFVFVLLLLLLFFVLRWTSLIKLFELRKILVLINLKSNSALNYCCFEKKYFSESDCLEKNIGLIQRSSCHYLIVYMTHVLFFCFFFLFFFLQILSLYRFINNVWKHLIFLWTTVFFILLFEIVWGFLYTIKGDNYYF